MKGWFVFCIFNLLTFCGICQQKVSFISSDGLKITADLYLKNYNTPFILLFHQNGCSRGEYKEIAQKLLNLDYNCLAVDLRSGGKTNYVKNETAIRAMNRGLSNKLIDARKDIIAAIEYTANYNKKPVILFGSSFSASLCMIVGKNNEKVDAVVAFSPGEYFEPEISVKNEIRNFNKPLFVSSSRTEYSYVVELLSEIPDNIKTIYKHSDGNKVHGAKALWDSNKTSRECWLELTMFFGKIKER
jgi:dienelactone hydrolase